MGWKRTLGLEFKAKGPMPPMLHPICMTWTHAALGILLYQMKGWNRCCLTSLPGLTLWESMNVIKFMNQLLCLEQVSLKYMQIALSIAVALLKRQSGIFT